MTLIREYQPADAAALAAHFVRSGYGPHHGASLLGANTMAAVLSERAPELFMVAMDGDDIVGCIGFMRGSGRRVTRDGELFAGLFVLDPRHRNSMLAGNMFVKSFEKLVAGGTRAMRIEANPTNKKAFPLYLRVGFRALPGAKADEDGYIELVSHLPGVIGDLLRSNIGDELSDVLPRFSWRNAAGGRDTAPTSGVTVDPDGSAVVSYDLSAGDFSLRASIAMDSGATLGYDVVSGSITELPLHAGMDRHGEAEPRAVWELAPGVVAQADTFGTVSILGPGFPGPVLVDHWPVVRGSTASGWRRPRLSPVAFEAREDGWRMSADGIDGTVTRDVRFGDGQMSISSVISTDDGGKELVVSPWVSMRAAEKYLVAADGTTVGGPVVRGIWPRDFTDFEACADEVQPELPARTTLWRNQSLALEASWPKNVTARHEGNHLPQLRGPANSTVAYMVAVNTAGSTPAPRILSTPAGITVEKVRRVQRTAKRAATQTRAVTWQASKRSGRDIVEHLGAVMELRYSETAGGVVGWSHDGNQILSSPYPGVRSWGSLTDWAAGLWVSRCAPRDNPEQGVEWVGSAFAIPLAGTVPRSGQDSWTLEAVDGPVPAIEVAAALAPGQENGDMAFYLTPASLPGASVLFGHPQGEKWVVEATGHAWTVGTSTIAVELQGGGYLVVRPVHGLHQELFVRSERKGLHLSLLSRPGEDGAESRWRISVLPHRSAALAEMDR